MSTLDDVLADLATEGDRLEQLLAPLSVDQWRRPTPAAGWNVAAQVAHLAWTDEVALAAATDKRVWDAHVLAALENPEGFVDQQALAGADVPPAQLLARWQESRRALTAALRAVPEGTKLSWFGPPMAPSSMATARFMETWAHALDVREALGVAPDPTDEIRHVAHLGVRTRNFAFANNDLTAPDDEFRVELTAPSGQAWTWGPESATQRVEGPAYDFCALVTQRVHRRDTALTAVGAEAERWLEIAQCFAGPAGGGREPRG